MSLSRSYWKAPAIYKDHTVVIIGGGPSLLETNLEKVSEAR